MVTLAKLHLFILFARRVIFNRQFLLIRRKSLSNYIRPRPPPPLHIVTHANHSDLLLNIRRGLLK
jgi:hypothetical protein